MPATTELKKAKEITGKMREIIDDLEKKYKDDDIEEGDVLVGLGKILQLKQDLIHLLNEMEKSKAGKPGSFEYWYLTFKYLDEEIEHTKAWAESWWTFIVTERLVEINLNTLSFSIMCLDKMVQSWIDKP